MEHSKTVVYNSPPNQASNARLMRLVTYLSVSVASILICVKTVAWLQTSSVAMLSTLIDSMLDASASFVNLMAVKHALEPADAEHRFGHGKAEPLAGLAQAAFIGGSAVFLVFQAIERFLDPQPVRNSEIGIIIMLVSIILTFCLIIAQKIVIRRTDSVAISADSLHYQGDLFVNLSVIGAILLNTQFDFSWADPLFALGIAGYIFWNAFQIIRTSLDLLMDKELPEEERARIKEIALAHPDVQDIHDMRTRSTGQRKFIQFHLEMSGDITLLEAHSIAEQVMYDIEDEFPNAEVLIHEDPAGIDERRAVFQ